MSLRVWLPLNGDLKNQGLDDVTVINNGATVNSSGKIGSCYYFDGSDDYISLGNISNYFTGNNFSISFWIKSLENTTRGVVFSSYGLSSTANFFSLEINSGTVTNNSLRFDWVGSDIYYTDANSITYNIWLHIAITYDGTYIKTYQNGILIKNVTKTLAGITTGNTYYLGRDNRTGSTSFNGYLNDFRVYDHCLSPKEVKLLAQGLVCHYPLNNNGQGNWNLLTGTKDFSGWYINTTMKVDGDVFTYEAHTSKAWHALSSPVIPFSDIVGKDLTISFEARSDDQDSLPDGNYPELTLVIKNTGPQATNYNTRIREQILVKSLPATNNWKRYSYTMKNITLDSFSTVHNNNSPDWVGVMMWLYQLPSVQFRHFKMEFGDKATPWCVAQSEAPDDIVYDTSGYCFNGTAKGTLTTLSDTPRYNVSTYFGSGNNYIDIGLASIRPKDEITVSMWVKYTTWGTAISCTEGGGWNFENGTNGIRFPVYVYGVGYKYTDSDVKPAALSDGNWHLLTGTMDSTNIKFYVDGELKTTTAKGSTNGIGYNTSNHIHIGAEAAGGENIASAAYVGSISDVRIYCTALSAEDILELYNIGASIDNDGNLYAAMIQES